MKFNIEVINDKEYISLGNVLATTKKYRDRIRDLEEENKKQDEFIEYWQHECDKKQNIINIIRDMFKNNHFEDGCDCIHIEELLESIDDYEN